MPRLSTSSLSISWSHGTKLLQEHVLTSHRLLRIRFRKRSIFALVIRASSTSKRFSTSILSRSRVDFPGPLCFRFTGGLAPQTCTPKCPPFEPRIRRVDLHVTNCLITYSGIPSSSSLTLALSKTVEPSESTLCGSLSQREKKHRSTLMTAAVRAHIVDEKSLYSKQKE